MHNVFIFGAGASRELGVPLMGEFIDTAEDLYTRAQNRLDNRAHFEAVFQMLTDLRSVQAKAYLDLDNIEAVLSSLEIGNIVGKLGTVTPTMIPELRDSLLALILDTIELSAPAAELDGTARVSTYRELARLLKHHRSSASRETFGLITLNYDLHLELALVSQGIPFSFCLNDTIPSGDQPVLKLHGSVGWGACPKCGKVVAIGDVGTPSLDSLIGKDRKAGASFLAASRVIATLTHCNGPCLRPLIVPPTWSKTSLSADMSRVWKHAAEHLGRANRIFLIGYSMPETDTFFRYLFAIALDSAARVRHLHVVNPDEAVEDRIRAFVGRSLGSRLQIDRSAFSDAWAAIKSTLS